MTDLIVLGIVLFALNKIPTGANDDRIRDCKISIVEFADSRDCCRSCENLSESDKILRVAAEPAQCSLGKNKSDR